MKDAVAEYGRQCNGQTECTFHYSSLDWAKKYHVDPWGNALKDVDVFYTCSGRPSVERHWELAAYGPHKDAPQADEVDIQLKCN
jgi:hypothetical protein